MVPSTGCFRSSSGVRSQAKRGGYVVRETGVRAVKSVAPVRAEIQVVSRVRTRPSWTRRVTTTAGVRRRRAASSADGGGAAPPGGTITSSTRRGSTATKRPLFSRSAESRDTRRSAVWSLVSPGTLTPAVGRTATGIRPAVMRAPSPTCWRLSPLGGALHARSRGLAGHGAHHQRGDLDLGVAKHLVGDRVPEGLAPAVGDQLQTGTEKRDARSTDRDLLPVDRGHPRLDPGEGVGELACHGLERGPDVVQEIRRAPRLASRAPGRGGGRGRAGAES